MRPHHAFALRFPASFEQRRFRKTSRRPHAAPTLHIFAPQAPEAPAGGTITPLLYASRHPSKRKKEEEEEEEEERRGIEGRGF